MTVAREVTGLGRVARATTQQRSAVLPSPGTFESSESPLPNDLSDSLHKLCVGRSEGESLEETGRHCSAVLYGERGLPGRTYSMKVFRGKRRKETYEREMVSQVD